MTITIFRKLKRVSVGRFNFRNEYPFVAEREDRHSGSCFGACSGHHSKHPGKYFDIA
jgi:hypothetical protein